MPRLAPVRIDRARDDTRWGDAVYAAQAQKRQVNCHSVEDLNLDAVADQVAREFPDYIVSPGPIVAPHAP